MEKKIRQVNLFRTNLAVADPDEEELNGEVLINSVVTDPEGNETERLTYNAEGDLDSRAIIIYSDGRPVEEVLEMEGEQAERTTREFNTDGRVTKEFRHYLDGEPDEISYEYNADGHLIRRQLTDSDGVEGERQLWVFNNKLMVREESYNEYGDLEISKTFSYSGDDKPEEVVELNFTGGEEIRLVTLFNNEGKVETEKRYDARGRLVARSIYIFDENGNNIVIEEESVRGKSIVNLQYDEAGNNVLQEETGPDGSIVSRIERVYDAENRPVSAEVRMENTPQRMGQHYRLRYEYLYY
ncbi:MAG: hypothetical protein V1775_15880 [Bacteroidota bacterium]